MRTRFRLFPALLAGVLGALFPGCVGGPPATPGAAPEAPIPFHAPPEPIEAAGHPGDLDAAERDLLDACARTPGDPRVWNALGLVAFRRRDVLLALVRFDRAVGIAGGVPELWIHRGMAQLGLGRYGPAAESFLRALRLGPDEELRLRSTRFLALSRVLQRGPGFPAVHICETDRFRVVSEQSEGHARYLAGLLTIAHGAYEALFPPPPARRAAEPFRVVAFADRARYTAFLSAVLDDAGTASLAGGSYHPLSRELVLHAGDDLDRAVLTLLHEGAHQYFDSFLPPPPLWFAEGVADYFGASRLRGRRLLPGLPHPDRVPELERVLAGFRGADLRRLLRAGRGEFMASSETDLRRRGPAVARNYTLAWAFVHLLLEGPPENRQLLDRYYLALRRGADPDRAFAEAFGDADFDRLADSLVRHARERFRAE